MAERVKTSFLWLQWTGKLTIKVEIPPWERIPPWLGTTVLDYPRCFMTSHYSMGGGTSSVVECLPLNWKVRCSIHGRWVNCHSTSWARVFTQNHPGRGWISSFGLLLTAVTKNSNYNMGSGVKLSIFLKAWTWISLLLMKWCTKIRWNTSKL